MKTASSKPLCIALSALAVAVAGSARQAAAQSLNCNQGIEYGTFASCGVASTATIAPTGGISTTGCISPIGSSLPGFCILTGIVGTTVITVAGPGNLVSGANNMAIDNFLLQVSGSPTPVAAISFTSASSPALSFNVGARIHIGATQAAGSYTGSYTVTTNYP